MIKKESLPDQPKVCRSGSAVRHLFWRLGETSYPADTQRKNNVIMTPKRRRDVIFDVVMTLLMRRVPVGYHQISLSQSGWELRPSIFLRWWSLSTMWAGPLSFQAPGTSRDVWIIPSFPIWGYVVHVEHVSCVITNCGQHKWVIPSPFSIALFFPRKAFKLNHWLACCLRGTRFAWI